MIEGSRPAMFSSIKAEMVSYCDCRMALSSSEICGRGGPDERFCCGGAPMEPRPLDRTPLNEVSEEPPSEEVIMEAIIMLF